MQGAGAYAWRVESSEETAGRIRLALVRCRERSVPHRFRQRVEVTERIVFFSRSFNPLLEGVAMARYEARLELAARYARDGELGCFVQTRSDGPNVEVILYERHFDGAEIHTEELARRVFDAGDERALVASTEFLADLRAWADRRNDERDAALLQAHAEDDARIRATSEQAAAGQELNAILATHIRAD